MDVRTVHTADLDAATRAVARELLDAAFEGEMTDEDWEHCLGGIHALAWEDGELIGHGAVGQGRLLYAGEALRTGSVAAVAVRAADRRRGVGGAIMDALNGVIGRAYRLGAL